ncbi:MAG: CHAT domain-containing protein [Flavobacteriaceae bacterium]|nr:CHAT domain-containing protein [Flavobacteriaceae bacterium]
MPRLFFFLLLIPFIGFSQDYNLSNYTQQFNNSTFNRQTVITINEKSIVLKQNGNYQDAIDLNNWLLEKINTKDSVFLAAEIFHTRSRIQIDLGEYNKAIATAKSSLKKYTSLKDKENIAALNNIIGVGYYFNSQLDSTLHYYNKSFFQKKELNASPWKLAISAYNLGIVYEDLAKYDQAIATYMEAVDLLLIDTSETNFLSEVYLAIGNTYKHKNDLVKALEFTTLALNEGLEKYGNDNPNISFVFESYAGVQQALGNYEVSKKYIYDFIKIREKYYGKNHKWTAQGYSDLAEILSVQKKNDSALWAINKAITIEKVVKNEADFGDIYFLKSHILTELKEYNNALSSLKLSKEFHKKVYGEIHKNSAEAFLQEAKIYSLLNEKESLKRSLQYTYQSANYSPQDLKTVNAPFVVLEALQLQFQFEEDSSKINLINQQIDLINYIKKFYRTHDAKLFFNSTTNAIIKEAITFCYLQYKKTDDLIFAEKAFELIQLNSNSILAEELQTINTFSGNTEEKEAYKSVKDLRQKWAQINQELFYEESSESPNKKNVDSLIKKRVVISRILDDAILSFENLANKSSAQLKIVSLQEVQKKLNSSQQVLQYFIGKEYIYGIQINNNSFLFQQLSNSEKTKTNIDILRSSIINRSESNEVEQLLFNALVAPIISETNKELIIIPDSFIGYIPFEILKSSANKLMVEEYRINYNPAISLLLLNEQEQNYTTDWTGFACSYQGNQVLPKGIEEISNISESMSGTTFINEKANSKNLFKQAQQSRILHLALHGKINKENALYSELLLNNEALTASQIYNEKIESDLVVLSACETGYGTIQKGEGIMSLSRAFTFAGASSTVMSLWEVPDLETSKIMQSFYQHLQNGELKSEALQNAKLDYLKNTNDTLLKHPFYWAGFVITGDNNPITKNEFSYGWWIFSILIVLCLLIFWVSFKRKKT